MSFEIVFEAVAFKTPSRAFVGLRFCSNRATPRYLSSSPMRPRPLSHKDQTVLSNSMFGRQILTSRRDIKRCKFRWKIRCRLFRFHRQHVIPDPCRNPPYQQPATFAS